MKLIAFGELRYIEKESADLFLRFQRGDGSTFDMPCTPDQLEVAAQEVLGAAATLKRQEPQERAEEDLPPARVPAFRSPHLPASVDDDAPLRLAVAQGGIDDDDL